MQNDSSPLQEPKGNGIMFMIIIESLPFASILSRQG
jgi:hypothetical protein